MEIETRKEGPADGVVQLLLRPYCLLCLEAEHELAQAGIAEFERVDIERDPALEARYGSRIPVVRRNGDDAELQWPFQAADVRALLGRA